MSIALREAGFVPAFFCREYTARPPINLFKMNNLPMLEASAKMLKANEGRQHDAKRTD